MVQVTNNPATTPVSVVATPATTARFWQPHDFMNFSNRPVTLLLASRTAWLRAFFWFCVPGVVRDTNKPERKPGVAPLLIQSRGDRHCHRCNLLNRGLRRLEHVHETASELHGDIHCHNSQHQADHQFHAYGELYGEAIVFGEIHRMKS